MILGIVSDTHGWLHSRLVGAMEGVDLIIHAGDVGRREIIDALATVAPVRAVYGNVDDTELRRRWPEWDRFDAEGVVVLMTHIGGRPGRWARGVGERLQREKPDVFVCGHSHILQIERLTEPTPLLFVNPGAAGREGFHPVKTCVRLHIADGRPVQAEVVHLDELPDEAGAGAR